MRPPSDEILFLPERPSLPPGTLREALMRTGREKDLGDARIHEVVSELGVGDVPEKVGGLEVERDWDEALSLGERQCCPSRAWRSPRRATQSWIGRRRCSDSRSVVRALDFLAGRGSPW